jgi:hypothetical protein
MPISTNENQAKKQLANLKQSLCQGYTPQRTIRCPDNLWDAIQGNKSEFIREAIQEKLDRLQ